MKTNLASYLVAVLGLSTALIAGAHAGPDLQTLRPPQVTANRVQEEATPKKVTTVGVFITKGQKQELKPAQTESRPGKVETVNGPHGSYPIYR
jgi:hypothetical protein